MHKSAARHVSFHKIFDSFTWFFHQQSSKRIWNYQMIGGNIYCGYSGNKSNKITVASFLLEIHLVFTYPQDVTLLFRFKATRCTYNRTVKTSQVLLYRNSNFSRLLSKILTQDWKSGCPKFHMISHYLWKCIVLNLEMNS